MALHCIMSVFFIIFAPIYNILLEIGILLEIDTRRKE